LISHTHLNNCDAGKEVSRMKIDQSEATLPLIATTKGN